MSLSISTSYVAQHTFTESLLSSGEQASGPGHSEIPLAWPLVIITFLMAILVDFLGHANQKLTESNLREEEFVLVHGWR